MAVKIYHVDYDGVPFFIRADWSDEDDPIQWSQNGEQWNWLTDLSTVADRQPREAMQAAIEESMLAGVGQAVKGMRQVSRGDFLQFVLGVRRGRDETV